MERKVTVSAEVGAKVRLQVPPDARYGRYVREHVTRFARTHDVPAGVVDEFVTAISEALANAIEHARSPETIEVCCWLSSDGQLGASIVDHGIGFLAEQGSTQTHLPDLMAERGRGLPIMRRYTDVCSIRSAPGQGTSVTLGRNVRKRSGAIHSR